MTFKPDKVNVTYTINQPKEDYIPGTRQVLHSLTKLLGIDVFELARTIADQENVGNIVCVAEVASDEEDEKVNHSKTDAVRQSLSDQSSGEEDNTAQSQDIGSESVVIGVFSILNLQQFGKLFEPLRNTIMAGHHDDLKRRCAGAGVGVLVAERMRSSVPDSVCKSFYVECAKDIQWTLALDRRDLSVEEIEELQYYEYQHLLITSWAVVPPSPSPQGKASPKKKLRKAVAKGYVRDGDDPVVGTLRLVNADMQRFFEHPERSPVMALDAHKRIWVAEEGRSLHAYLLIFVVPFAALPTI